MADYYTWSQFKQLVRQLCPLDSIRKGVGTSGEDFFERNLRQAVLNLQSAIDSYKRNHETVYEMADLIQEDKALRGVKPPESIVRDCWFVRIFNQGEEDEEAQRHPCSIFDWSERFQLVHGNETVGDNRARISFDPNGYTFYLYPAPPDDQCWVLSMFWDGLKLDFRDCEHVPFTEMTAEAVASWIKAKVALDVEKNSGDYDTYMKAFAKTKALLYADCKEKSGMKG